jgi:hypothetical protein
LPDGPDGRGHRRAHSTESQAQAATCESVLIAQRTRSPTRVSFRLTGWRRMPNCRPAYGCTGSNPSCR